MKITNVTISEIDTEGKCLCVNITDTMSSEDDVVVNLTRDDLSTSEKSIFDNFLEMANSKL